LSSVSPYRRMVSRTRTAEFDFVSRGSCTFSAILELAVVGQAFA
jgi:hypothetical protein